MWGVTHDASPWENVAGSLRDIGVAWDGTVWGVNSFDNVHRYTGDQPS
ncbi:tectonin domain-containing protein [Streptomyces atroolivaceus]|uniref:Tectonin domain-containing protein n=1 Tax=Streptomyces atroolivaceus TaxID=66869 RepID=A0ABV9VIJ5_STRAZ